MPSLSYVLAIACLSAFLARPAGAQPRAEPELEPAFAAPSGPATPQPEPAGDPVARGSFGPLAGLGLIAASTAVGALVGVMISPSCPPGDLCFGPALPAAIGASIGSGIGLALLYPLGVALGADAAGGRGGVGWSYLGGLIGTLVGVGIFGAGWALYEALGENGIVVASAIALGAGASLVGPILAYEISDHQARRSSDLGWIPTLRITAHGASCGVAGRF